MIDRINMPSVVYVIDSDPLDRSLIAKSLRTHQFEVSCHENCDEIAAAYSPERDGCLVIDFNFTSNGGLQAARYLADRGVRIPVVYVAAAARAADAVAAMKTGAIDFLEKPVLDEELLRAVQSGIQKDSDARQQLVEQAGVAAREQRLTQRERETKALVLNGRSVKQIASEFGIGLQTAAKHRSRLLSKMNVHSDAQLVRLYYSCGLGNSL